MRRGEARRSAGLPLDALSSLVTGLLGLLLRAAACNSGEANEARSHQCEAGGFRRRADWSEKRDLGRCERLVIRRDIVDEAWRCLVEARCSVILEESSNSVRPGEYSPVVPGIVGRKLQNVVEISIEGPGRRPNRPAQEPDAPPWLVSASRQTSARANSGPHQESHSPSESRVASTAST
jgi:hypothetical protein